MKHSSLFLLFFSTLAFSACKKATTLETLVGTEWKVINYQTSTKSKLTSVRSLNYILKFETDSSYSLALYINGCGGNYIYNASNKSIDISGLYCSEACCDHEKSVGLLESLGGIRTVNKKGNSLFLNGESSIELKEK